MADEAALAGFRIILSFTFALDKVSCRWGGWV